MPFRTAYEATSSRWRNTSIEDLQRGNFYLRDETYTRSVECARIKNLDSLLTLQSAAEDLETKLNIESRWTPDSLQWKETAANMANHEYLLAVDKLEGLIVACLFELMKLNQSGTGRSCLFLYSISLLTLNVGVKLRTHIAKALKSRSQAIYTALKIYNEAATRLTPPRPCLDIAQVLDYVFIGQFDLLRDSCHNVLEKPWTCAAEHEAASLYFKIQRAREEISRLNVEVRRLWTFMADEEAYLRKHIRRLEVVNRPLAQQLQKILVRLLATNTNHCYRLKVFRDSTPEFSGLILQGLRKG